MKRTIFAMKRILNGRPLLLRYNIWPIRLMVIGQIIKSKVN